MASSPRNLSIQRTSDELSLPIMALTMDSILMVDIALKLNRIGQSLNARRDGQKPSAVGWAQNILREVSSTSEDSNDGLLPLSASNQTAKNRRVGSLRELKHA